MSTSVVCLCAETVSFVHPSACQLLTILLHDAAQPVSADSGLVSPTCRDSPACHVSSLQSLKLYLQTLLGLCPLSSIRACPISNGCTGCTALCWLKEGRQLSVTLCTSCQQVCCRDCRSCRASAPLNMRAWPLRDGSASHAAHCWLRTGARGMC